MFRGRPDILTPGRYVRVPEGTPHYPGFHNLGSKFWTMPARLFDNNDLGEDDETKVIWDRGLPAGPLPIGGLIGSPSCIESGETDGPAFPLPLIGGFDARCFELIPPPVPPPPVLPPNIRDRAVQIRMAEILELQYGNTAAAAANLQAFLGPTYTVTAIPNDASAIPGRLIATGPAGTVVVISGTTNFQQWALQAMTSGTGPTRFGAYATLPLWQLSANAIAGDMLAAGVPDTGPVTLVGHSYGGAVANVLAAQARLATPDRPISVLTYGSPHVGDTDLVNLLRRVISVNLVNDGDVIPLLPPGSDILNFLVAVGGGPLLQNWAAWKPPPNQQGVTDAGRVYDNPSTDTAFDGILSLLTKIILGQPIPVVTAHLIGEYVTRLKKVPPLP